MQVFEGLPPDVISVARDLMQAAQLPRLLVIDGEGRVIGIVSQGDAALETGDEKAAGETLANVGEPSTVRG